MLLNIQTHAADAADYVDFETYSRIPDDARVWYIAGWIEAIKVKTLYSIEDLSDDTPSVVVDRVIFTCLSTVMTPQVLMDGFDKRIEDPESGMPNRLGVALNLYFYSAAFCAELDPELSFEVTP